MIYVINGSAQSGKDTFCQMVSKFTGENFTKVFSTVELVKQAARDFGWDGEKTARARKFLSDLKDLLTDWDDIPYKDIERKIRSANADWEYFGIDTSRCAIFVMCREPEEIRKFVDRIILERDELAIWEFRFQKLELKTFVQSRISNCHYQ